MSISKGGISFKTAEYFSPISVDELDFFFVDISNIRLDLNIVVRCFPPHLLFVCSFKSPFSCQLVHHFWKCPTEVLLIIGGQVVVVCGAHKMLWKR
jgi:hypothetical protein